MNTKKTIETHEYFFVSFLIKQKRKLTKDCFVFNKVLLIMLVWCNAIEIH